MSSIKCRVSECVEIIHVCGVFIQILATHPLLVNMLQLHEYRGEIMCRSNNEALLSTQKETNEERMYKSQ